MEETIRTLLSILDSLKNQHGVEFTNFNRAGNQASMANNIVKSIQAELDRLEEECERCEQWKKNAGADLSPQNACRVAPDPE